MLHLVSKFYIVLRKLQIKLDFLGIVKFTCHQYTRLKVEKWKMF